MATKPWERYANQPQQPVAPPDPRIPVDVQETRANIQRIEQQIGDIQEDRQVEREDRRREEQQRDATGLRRRLNNNIVLDAIREARQIVQNEGGLGYENLLLSRLPNTTARKLEGAIAPVLSNLSTDRLAQMRADSPTGGALGNVTERELAMLQASVASLDLGVDPQTFLDRLDRVERYFMGSQMAMAGFDPTGDDAPALFREFGYTGFRAGDEAPQEGGELAASADTEKAGELPQEYQQAHLRYLRDNWGNITPEGYVSFRSQLDQQYGQTPNIQAYRDAVDGFNSFAQQGGQPEALGAVPAAPESRGAFEQLMNKAAASPYGGAAAANYFNAAAAGLPAAIAGNQQEMGLLREARPYQSFFGELAGGVTGGALTGGLGAGLSGGMQAGRIARIMNNPVATEAAYGGTYGALQDPDNAARGAMFGAAGGAGGAMLGKAIGRAFPETYGRTALDEADNSAPTIDRLKEQAAELYADAEANGIAADTSATQDLAQRANMVLAGAGRIGGDGRPVIQDGNTKQAYDLIQSYADAGMTPTQAQTVRETLGEGLTSQTPKERRIAAMLLQEFDDWVQPVMPGAEQARSVASRYIRGQQLQDATGLGTMRGNRAKGNDVADSVRTRYGQIDESAFQGRSFYDQPTQEAISRVAQGDRITNSLRNIGKYGFNSVLPTAGIGAAGFNAGALGGDAALMAVPAAVGGVGTLARRAASNRTLRAAKEAELLALGGEEYQRALREAYSKAADNGGRFYGGLFGVGASQQSRRPAL